MLNGINLEGLKAYTEDENALSLINDLPCMVYLIIHIS